MRTRRIVFGALAVFVLAWGTMLVLALRTPRPDAPRERAPARADSPARYDLAEVARHDRAEDCWLVIRGAVYDVTSYIEAHPAPRAAIVDHCGRESTRAFETKDLGRPHSRRAWQLLDDYRIGELAP